MGDVAAASGFIYFLFNLQTSCLRRNRTNMPLWSAVRPNLLRRVRKYKGSEDGPNAKRLRSGLAHIIEQFVLEIKLFYLLGSYR